MTWLQSLRSLRHSVRPAALRHLAPSRGHMAGAMAVMVPLAAVVTGLHTAPHTRHPHLLLSSAWLVSRQIGEVELVDGASPGVDDRMDVGDLGDDLRGAQSGPDGYVLDVTDGSVTRLDGRTLTDRRSPDLGRVQGARVSLSAAGADLTILDQDEGVAVQADPTGLRPQGRQVSVGGQVADADSVVDGAGALWVVQKRAGRLLRVAAGTSRDTGAVSRDALLTRSAGTALLVDPARHRVAELGARGVERWVSLPGLNAPVAAVHGVDDTTQPRLLVSSRRSLLDCRLTTRSCATLADEPAPMSDPAALAGAVDVSGHLFVPDIHTGTVLVIDLARHTIRRTGQILASVRPFALTVQGGLTFFNDPDSEQAGTIAPDGTVQRIDKYTAQDVARAKARAAHHRDTSTKVPIPTATPTNRPATPSATTSAPPTARPTPRGTGSGPGTDPSTKPTSSNNPRPSGTGPPTDGPGTGLTILVTPGRTGTVGETFTLSARDPSGVALTSAAWQFGDGGSGKGLPSTHAFTKAGSYRVQVQAASAAGSRSGWTTIDVGVKGGAPHLLGLGTEPTPPITGRNTTLSVRSTGQIDRWSWSVRGPGLSTTMTASDDLALSFPKAGSYIVTVDASGPGGSDRLSHVVKAEKPSATCGEVVVTDLVLNTDLDCQGDGLMAGATGITIDLAGHTITGHGYGRGLAVSGFTRVTFTDGVVTGYPTGTLLSPEACLSLGAGASATTFSDLTLEGCGLQAIDRADATTQVTLNAVTVHSGAVRFSGIHDATVAHCRGWNHASLDFLDNSQPATVEDNEMTSTAISGTESDNAVISRNVFTDSTIGIDANDRFIQVVANTFSGEYHDGQDNPSIWINSETGTMVKNNVFQNGWVGIEVRHTTDLVIDQNQFMHEAAAGIYGENAGNVKISNSTMTQNGRRPSQFDDPGGNHVNDGIHLYETGNAPTGAPVLTDNHGQDNADQAIYAGPGPVSGSGNTSKGDPGDCTGVACG